MVVQEWSGGMNTRSGICRCRYCCHCHCRCILFVLILLRSSPFGICRCSFKCWGATSAAALPSYCSATVGILASCYFYAWPHEKLSPSYLPHISAASVASRISRSASRTVAKKNFSFFPLRFDCCSCVVAGAGGCGLCNAAAAVVACEVRTRVQLQDLVEFRIVCASWLCICVRAGVLAPSLALLTVAPGWFVPFFCFFVVFVTCRHPIRWQPLPAANWMHRFRWG